MKMTKPEVIELMKNSESEEQWNKNCDEVKSTYDGDYPDFWFREIICSSWLRGLHKSFQDARKE